MPARGRDMMSPDNRPEKRRVPLVSPEPPGIGPRAPSRRARATSTHPLTAAPPGPPEAPRNIPVPRDEAATIDRKLIRPRLDQHVVRGPGRPTARRRPRPPDQTGLEASFYAQQASATATVAVTLEDGRILRGVVEWNDRDCLSVRCKDLPPIVVMKHVIVHVSPDEDVARRV